jgi:hypothetical protein
MDDEKLVAGNIIVKYDMEVCGKYGNLEQALKRIRSHHLVKDNPNEAQYFEFYAVLGPGQSPFGHRSGLPGNYDALGRRCINSYVVLPLGNLLKAELS